MAATIIFILILSFLVLIHELGHYFAARWAKIKVEEFGLGYPPQALKLFKIGSTIFSLNWIPFGGFVRMEGEDSQRPKKSKKISAEKEGPFYEKTAWQRLVVILAGVVINFLFGVIAFSVVYSVIGIPTFINQARIGQVAQDSPAAQAQIPTNVNIIAVRNQDEVVATDSNEAVIEVVSRWRGQTVTIVTSGECQGFSCQESAQEFEVYLRNLEETPANQGSLGVAFETSILAFYPWYEMPFRGMWVGLQQALMLGMLIISSLGEMIGNIASRGEVPTEVAGPVGIVHQASQAGVFKEGFLMTLNFAGMLSVNLAIMNLLPIPALDGGRALFILLEKVVGRQKIERVEGYANYGGFVILVSLILLVTFRDVWRIFVQ